MKRLLMKVYKNIILVLILLSVLSIGIHSSLVFITKFSSSHYGKLSQIGNIQELGSKLKEHLNTYDVIPTNLKWCDVLAKDYNITKTSFVLSSEYYYSRDKLACYSLNEHILGRRVTEINNDTVLLFESKPGWNQIGGSELLEPNYSEDKGCFIYYFDGSIEFVNKEKFSILRWK